MATRKEENAGAGVPALFPLPAPQWEQFATAGNFLFGWTPEAGSAQGKFVVSKFRWSGGSGVIASWPLTEEGWEAAWGYMTTEQPELATAVPTLWHKTTETRAAYRRRAENKANLDAEGELDVLAGCVLLGGYGFDTGVALADRVDIHFTQRGIWMTKRDGFKPYLHRSYESSRVLEFKGGTVRKGGGYFGGGFGLLGAAEGIAMASLLNSLTTKTSVHTTIRFEADDAEVFFFTDQATPRNLEMRLAEVRARVKTSPPPPSPPEVQPAAAADFADRLLRLGEMLDKGHLSAEEFAIAKARFFTQPD